MKLKLWENEFSSGPIPPKEFIHCHAGFECTYTIKKLGEAGRLQGLIQNYATRYQAVIRSTTLYAYSIGGQPVHLVTVKLDSPGRRRKKQG